MKRRTASESLRRARQILLNIDLGAEPLLDDSEVHFIARHLADINRNLLGWAEMLQRRQGDAPEGESGK